MCGSHVELQIVNSTYTWQYLQRGCVFNLQYTEWGDIGTTCWHLGGGDRDADYRSTGPTGKTLFSHSFQNIELIVATMKPAYATNHYDKNKNGNGIVTEIGSTLRPSKCRLTRNGYN